MISKIRNKLRTLQYLQKKKQLFELMNISNNDVNTFKKELDDSKLITHIKQGKQQYEQEAVGQNVRGHELTFGGLGEQESYDLYTMLRVYQPDTFVETGVCNGVSSSIILQAFKENKKGRLISIDFPEILGMVYEDGTFWERKGGSAIPKEKQPGWIIPDALRDRWELSLGKSQDLLPGLLEKEGEIDIFMHDSEHSYDCMYFEYDTAFPFIKKGGILISDDIFANDAFDDFSSKHQLKSHYLSHGVGIVFK